ncbi:hypothetical protein INT45_004475, partial [Circinella minor]
IEEYILNHENQPLTLAKFIEDKTSFIVSKIALGEDVKSVWSERFQDVALVNKMNVNKSHPNWNALNNAYKEYLKQNTENHAQPEQPIPVPVPTKNTTTKTSTSNSSSDNSTIDSSKNTSYRLTKDELYNFEKMFEGLDQKSFWTLSTGTVVELKMKEFALSCNYEHPVHSMILDTNDNLWKNYFTPDELNEIEAEKEPTFHQLPKVVLQYLNNYKLLKTLDDMWEEGIKHHFHPVRQPLMYWVHTSVIRCIDILLQNVHKKYKTEADLMKRIWILIDCCFDEGELNVIW